MAIHTWAVCRISKLSAGSRWPRCALVMDQLMAFSMWFAGKQKRIFYPAVCNPCLYRCVHRALLGRRDSKINVGLFKGQSMKDKLLTTGIIGTIIAALCCFTPLLVWALTAIGLSAAISYLDIVLLPALGFFIILTGYALWRRKKTK